MYNGWIDVVSAKSALTNASTKQHQMQREVDPLLSKAMRLFRINSVPSVCGRQVIFIGELARNIADCDRDILEKYGHLIFEGVNQYCCASNHLYLPKSVPAEQVGRQSDRTLSDDSAG